MSLLTTNLCLAQEQIPRLQWMTKIYFAARHKTQDTRANKTLFHSENISGQLSSSFSIGFQFIHSRVELFWFPPPLRPRPQILCSEAEIVLCSLFSLLSFMERKLLFPALREEKERDLSRWWQRGLRHNNIVFQVIPLYPGARTLCLKQRPTIPSCPAPYQLKLICIITFN